MMKCTINLQLLRHELQPNKMKVLNLCRLQIVFII